MNVFVKDWTDGQEILNTLSTAPRDKPKKRGARQHKKNKSKHEKRQQKQTRYKGQGKG
jgi:hypothetical protein